MKQLFYLVGFVCLIVLLLPACAPQPEQPAEPVAQEAPNTEADVEAIKASLAQSLARGEAGDFEGWLAFQTEDVVIMPPNHDVVEGKAEVRQWAQPYFDQFTIKETSTFDEIQVFGDWAFGRGSYDTQFVPKEEGDTVHEKGKFIYIFKRQADNSWKLARGMWNTNNPPPTEPTT